MWGHRINYLKGLETHIFYNKMKIKATLYPAFSASFVRPVQRKGTQ